jgi:hypothetical protein
MRRLCVTARALLLACGVAHAFQPVPGSQTGKSAPHVDVSSLFSGQRLHGGDTATIRWDAVSLPAKVEEWEAFLSFDGGRSYALRITPHLGISVREFAWSVPNVDTSSAKILLRFGNERDESAIELPARFTIEHRIGFPPLWSGAHVGDHRGEAARDGDDGVFGWVCGDRSGRDAHAVVTRDASMAASPRAQIGASERGNVVAAPTTSLAIGRSPFAHSIELQRETVQTCADVRHERDILLLCRRLNV